MNGVTGLALGPFGLSQAWSTDPNPSTIAAMTHQSDTVMVTEKFAADTNKSNWVMNGLDGWDGPVVTEDIGPDNQYQHIPNGTKHPEAIVNGVDTLWPVGPFGGVFGPHAGKANFVFLDGHVKTMTPSRDESGIRGITRS